MVEFPPQLAARYRPLEALGSGASGVVVRAHQVSLDRTVVVKLAAPANAEERARVLAEARILAELRHPNVVELLDHGTAGDRVYLVYPDEGGAPLDACRDASILAGETGARWLAAQVLAGLAAAHDRGVLHRDIKPANMILTGDGRLRLIDFGLAKLHEVGPELTATGVFVGTPLYASPGMLRGDPAEPRDDLYALGVLLHEHLAGCHPFGAEDLAGVFHAHFYRVAPRLEGVTPEFATLVDALLSKAPEDRPAGAEEAAAWLARLPEPGPGGAAAKVPEATARVPRPVATAVVPGAARSEAPDPPASTGGRLRRGLAVGALALFLAWWAWPRSPRPASPESIPTRSSTPTSSRSERFQGLAVALPRELEAAQQLALDGDLQTRPLPPTLPAGWRPLFSDDPQSWPRAFAVLPSLEALYGWVEESGQLEDLASSDRDRLDEVDQLLRAAGLPRLTTGLEVLPAPTPISPDVDPFRRLDLSPALAAWVEGEPRTGWYGAFVREYLAYRSAVEATDARLSAAFQPEVVDESLPANMRLGGRLHYMVARQSKSVGGRLRTFGTMFLATPRGRASLVELWTELAVPARRFLVAATRSLRQEPARAEGVSQVIALVLRRYPLFWQSEIGGLPRDLIERPLGDTGPDRLVAGSLATMRWWLQEWSPAFVEPGAPDRAAAIRAAARRSFVGAARAEAEGAVARERRHMALGFLLDTPLVEESAATLRETLELIGALAPALGTESAGSLARAARRVLRKSPYVVDLPPASYSWVDTWDPPEP